jgi:hypothetical protein
MRSHRGIFKWCKIQQKVVPADEVLEEVHANVAHGYIPDEMAAVKHPIDGKYYTSKAKFRAVTRSHGYEEVGTAYENGYDPEKRKESVENARIQQIAEHFKERYRDGKARGRS